MSAYLVFTREKTLDEAELKIYWDKIRGAIWLWWACSLREQRLPRRRIVKGIVAIGMGRLGGAFAIAFAKRTSHVASIRLVPIQGTGADRS